MWFAEITRAAGLALALTAALALGACTLTPVYGERAETRLALAYAEPGSRLEQLVYRTLSARLGQGAAGAPVLSAQVNLTDAPIGISRVPSPVAEHQVMATVSYSLTRDGSVLTSGSRAAAANYQTTGQIVADGTARAAAEEQATIAAAEAVRLALIAELSGP